MFEIREGDLPVLRTRQALLCLDLENDLYSTGCILPVNKPAGWVNNICTLVPTFRPAGKVIWIRSQFDVHRPINDGKPDSEYVITDNELSGDHEEEDVAKGSRPKPSKRLIDLYDKILAKNGGTNELPADEGEEELYDNETFFTIEQGKMPVCMLPMTTGSNFIQAVIPAMSSEEDIFTSKSHYSAFKSGHLIQTLRAQFVTELFICGALTNISVFATAMDAARYGYSITLIEDCIGYRSKARHDEAIKQLVEATGCEVITSAELIERRRPKSRSDSRRVRGRKQEREVRNSQSLSQMLNLLKIEGESGTDSLVPVQSASLKPDPNPEYGDFDTDVKESSRGHIVNVENESLPVDLLLKKPAEKPARVPSKIKTRRRLSKTHLNDKEARSGEASTNFVTLKDQAFSPTRIRLMAASEVLKKMSPDSNDDTPHAVNDTKALTHVDFSTHLEVGSSGDEKLTSDDLIAHAKQLISRKIPRRVVRGGPIEKNRPENPGIPSNPAKAVENPICEGDTTVITNLLPNADSIFERVRDEVRWQKMSHQGGEVPRLVGVQGEILKDGSIPIYRHPADESPSLLPFSLAVSEIRREVEKRLKHKVNHCLIQFYRSGTDYISEHSDKTLDIVPDTFIANVSLGAMRTMTFRTKKPLKTDDTFGKDDASVRQSCKAPLPHNSMCKMGLKTNTKWLHSIRQDKRAVREKTPEELAYDGGRISLTFRSIGTYLSKDQTKIWGQGAVSKTQEEAGSVLNGKTPESEAMIKAFGLENHSSVFDWAAVYGDGFDVLHMSNNRTLFLSGDPLVDLRIKIMLAECRVSWTLGKLSPSFTWKSDSDLGTTGEAPEKFQIKLVDNNLARSVVETELAIMLYIETLYGPKRILNQGLVGNVFTRLGQVQQISEDWREVMATSGNEEAKKIAFKRRLHMWEGFVRQDAFISCSYFQLADIYLFPILRDVVLAWGGLGDEFPALTEYYELLRMRSSVMEALGEGGGEGGEGEGEEKKPGESD